MPRIQINNTDLHYIERGEGKETLFFCHGLLFNHKMYNAQIDFFSSKYRCIAIDFRGQGYSQVTEDGYDMDTLTQDIYSAIQKLTDGPVHFIGLSMGGFVGMRLAARYPKLLKSLMLLNTSAGAEPFSKIIKYKLLLFIAKTLGIGPVVSGVEKTMYGKSFLKDPKNKPTRDFWAKTWKEQDIQGLIRATEGVIQRKDFAREELGKIITPTLIVGGSEDKALPPQKSTYLQKHIPNSQLKFLEGVGHSTCLEAPDLLNTQLENFLSEINKS
ncbi:MAG: alpha/beta hydrolase [Aureispira sp.]|nr:alpha/beta hydrolase [Aureispira sp.]